MCQKSSSVSCEMLLVQPGMSESEQPMDLCYSDLQRYGPKHTEIWSVEQGMDGLKTLRSGERDTLGQ